MANRYWVGGTGNWTDSTNHWSTTSGGSPAELQVPASSDDVFIDANSGFGSGGTITLDDDVQCHDFTASSGHTYTITDSSLGHDLGCYGSVVFESGLTFESSKITGGLKFNSVDSGETITIGGATLTSGVTFYGTGSFVLQDDLICSGQFYQDNGTFDANDHNVTANDFYFYADTGFTPTVVMGSGTWETTGGNFGTEQYSGEVATINPENSTIKLTAGTLAFYDDAATESGKNYYKLLIPAGSDTVIDGSNIFNEIAIGEGSLVGFNSLTNTVTNFIANGSIGNLITLYRNWESGQFTLSKSSGNVHCDFLDISNSNVTGGATWYAGAHSVDTANNDGWIFDDFPPRHGASNFQLPGII